MKNIFYAAYGSNMNHEQMARRCPDAVKICNGIINNYKLLFAYKGVATIEPSEGDEVSVVVWLISTEDEKKLDIYEGYPTLYRKEMVTVDLENSGDRQQIMAYILNEPYCHRRDKLSKQYYDIIRTGYITNGIDLEKLNRVI